MAPSLQSQNQEITVTNIDKWFGKEIKDKIDELLSKKIKVFNQNKKRQAEMFGQKELVRPYINSVTIKLFKDKSYLQNSTMGDNFLKQKSNFEMFEQEFRITCDTTFDELKDGALEFWGET